MKIQKNGFMYSLFILFMIVLVIYGLYQIYVHVQSVESFHNYCILNEQKNKECINQVNYLPIGFPIPCPTEEECDLSIRNKIHYWCSIQGKCYEKIGTEDANEISRNVCGTDILNNQILFPYDSKENCERKIDPCEEYNKNKEECLKNTNCGYCINNNINEGKCISGTESGPNDLEKYYFCIPNQKNKYHRYEYGNHALYIL